MNLDKGMDLSELVFSGTKIMSAELNLVEALFVNSRAPARYCVSSLKTRRADFPVPTWDLNGSAKTESEVKITPTIGPGSFYQSPGIVLMS